jgi:hypothetical protein
MQQDILAISRHLVADFFFGAPAEQDLGWIPKFKILHDNVSPLFVVV